MCFLSPADTRHNRCNYNMFCIRASDHEGKDTRKTKERKKIGEPPSHALSSFWSSRPDARITDYYVYVM